MSESADYPTAIWSPSPNFYKGRRAAPQFVVIHITDGQAHVDRAVEHLCRPENIVSANFLIGQGAEIHQLVRLVDRAKHCSGWNDLSLGIEHCARTPRELSKTDPGLPLTKGQLEGSARLVAWLCRRYGWTVDLNHIRPHCASPTTTHRDCARDIDDGGIWPWTSYLAMVGAALSSLQP